MWILILVFYFSTDTRSISSVSISGFSSDKDCKVAGARAERDIGDMTSPNVSYSCVTGVGK